MKRVHVPVLVWWEGLRTDRRAAGCRLDFEMLAFFFLLLQKPASPEELPLDSQYAEKVLVKFLPNNTKNKRPPQL